MLLTKQTSAPESLNGLTLNYQEISKKNNVVENGDNNSRFPVFRINQEGKIMYANRAAFPILKSWNCNASNKIPNTIHEHFPVLTDLEADQTIEMTSDYQKFSFYVVGFRLGGYVGVYGFKTEQVPDSSQHN